MKGIHNEGDLGNAYSDWLSYKSLGEGREHIRFGQYVYNEYDLEYKNSYNVRSELDAYNILSEYIYLKGLENESK